MASDYGHMVDDLSVDQKNGGMTMVKQQKAHPKSLAEVGDAMKEMAKAVAGIRQVQNEQGHAIEAMQGVDNDRIDKLHQSVADIAKTVNAQIERLQRQVTDLQTRTLPPEAEERIAVAEAAARNFQEEVSEQLRYSDSRTNIALDEIKELQCSLHGLQEFTSGELEAASNAQDALKGHIRDLRQQLTFSLNDLEAQIKALRGVERRVQVSEPEAPVGDKEVIEGEVADLDKGSDWMAEFMDGLLGRG